ncbi:hypothetical protein H310_07929 [Aphanomyces invadans]|uniref:Cyclic nucleotide-binding domain-containing protein n=1 Tax=Aphanomyces invadans TaxID=157072 RepID=A0A024U105_9STRA|nr:hypothetical protein H310_07929 [Aphanomyces invadans]ETV99898.1 hypothetical protein H310_07929 [Aphanomyces invadans]|eukprot:XP_008871674.1 hypothetical protein H310_07929 [Aphanomyces invadans]
MAEAEGKPPPPRRALANAVSKISKIQGSSTKLNVGGPRMQASFGLHGDLDIDKIHDEVHFASPLLSASSRLPLNLGAPIDPRTQTMKVMPLVTDPVPVDPICPRSEESAPRMSDVSKWPAPTTKSPWPVSGGSNPRKSIVDVINAVNLEKKMAKKLHENVTKRRRASEAMSTVVKTAKRMSRSMTMNRRNGIATMDAVQLETELNNLSSNYISKLAQDHQTFVISIHSHIKVWWDAVLAIVTLYAIIMIPMDLCFDVGRCYGWVPALQGVVEIVFAIDILVTFRTSFLDSATHEEVVDIGRIRQHYLTSWFCIDVVGSVPSCAVGTSIEQSNVAYLRLLVFLRILRLSTSPTFSEFMSWASRKFTSYLIRLVVLVTMYLLLHHYIACSYYLLVFWESHEVERWAIPFGANDSLDVKYVSSFYRGLAITSGSDLGAVTSIERVWSTSMFVIGIIANACVAGICASVLAQMNKVQDEQSHLKEAIHTRLRNSNAGEDLQERVLAYFDSAHGRETAHHAVDLFKGMPSKLHFELSVALNHAFLDKVPLFRTLEPEGIVALLECVDETVAMTGDIIIRAGEEGRAFYMIKMGSVEIYDDSSGKHVSIKHMEAGNTFGEMALLRNGVASASVVATSFCVLLVLYKDIFQWITRENDQVRTFWERSRVKQMETSELVVQRASLVEMASDVTREVGIVHYLTNKVFPKRMQVMLRKVRMRKAARKVLLLQKHHRLAHHDDNERVHRPSSQQFSQLSNVSTRHDGATQPSPHMLGEPPTIPSRPDVPNSAVSSGGGSTAKRSRFKMAAKKVRASPMGNAHMLVSMLKGRQTSARALAAVSKMSQIAAKDMVDAQAITKANILYRADES